MMRLASVHIPTILRFGDMAHRKLVLQNRAHFWCAVLLSTMLASCASVNKTYNPERKFSPQQLHQDYQIFQSILQERHPGLYWYSSKQKMDSIFEQGKNLLGDSLTETGFRTVLSKVITQVQCGHTSIRYSKAFVTFNEKLKTKSTFPLSIKTWSDTIIAASNLPQTTLKRSDMITAINGQPTAHLLDTMMQFVPADGNNIVAKSQLLSSANYFGNLYLAVMGKSDQWVLDYIDSNGAAKQATLLMPKPARADSTRPEKKQRVKRIKKSSAEKRMDYRSMVWQDSNNYAVMRINSFSPKAHLKPFVRKAFKKLNKQQIQNLIIDLRLNGGGSISNSTFLTRFLIKKSFTICDSVYATASSSKFSRYIKNDFLLKAYIRFFTTNIDNHCRMLFLENRSYRPFVKRGYKGHVFMLSGGYTYSASTLVLNNIKGQDNITIVGEPTGGAAYGNSAMMIPDVTLPNTKLRIRLPIFRVVINKNVPQNGQGILPDVYALPTPKAIREAEDYKMKAALDLIKTSR